MFASQLAGHCDVISHGLWRHDQSVKPARETLGRCVQIVVLSSFMDLLCRVRNKKCMQSRDEPLMRSLECYSGVYFRRYFVTREINTKMTLSRAHQQFATRVQTIFNMSTEISLWFTMTYEDVNVWSRYRAKERIIISHSICRKQLLVPTSIYSSTNRTLIRI